MLRKRNREMREQADNLQILPGSSQSMDKTQEIHLKPGSLKQEKGELEVQQKEENSDQKEGKSLGEKDEEYESGAEEQMGGKNGILKEVEEEENRNGGPRERLKRHRTEVAGHVWIPDMWGQEDLLMDWIDCSAFDTSLVPKGIISARASLIQEGRRATSAGIRVQNSF